MIGDVNFFLNDHDDPYNAEIDIMIAEKSFRRGGYGTEAVQLMMDYASRCHGIKRIYAKIGSKNTPSQHLFQK